MNRGIGLLLAVMAVLALALVACGEEEELRFHGQYEEGEFPLYVYTVLKANGVPVILQDVKDTHGQPTGEVAVYSRWSDRAEVDPTWFEVAEDPHSQAIKYTLMGWPEETYKFLRHADNLNDTEKRELLSLSYRVQAQTLRYLAYSDYWAGSRDAQIQFLYREAQVLSYADELLAGTTALKPLNYWHLDCCNDEL